MLNTTLRYCFSTDLDAQFPKRLRHEEAANGCHDWSVGTSQNDDVVDVQSAVHENDVNRRAETRQRLHLKQATMPSLMIKTVFNEKYKVIDKK